MKLAFRIHRNQNDICKFVNENNIKKKDIQIITSIEEINGWKLHCLWYWKKEEVGK